MSASQRQMRTQQQIEMVKPFMSEATLARFIAGEFGVYGGVGLPAGSKCPEIRLFHADGACFQAIAKKRKELVDFFYVYIEEAHPKDGWTTLTEKEIPLDKDPTYQNIPEPNTFEARAQLAKRWHAKCGLDAPLLIDDIDNRMNIAFAARPERLYITDGDTILYQGGEGPEDYSIDDMAQALDNILAKIP